MNHEEFKIGFDKLVQAFNVINAEKKARIYFDELNEIQAGDFFEIVSKAIKECDHWPTISKLLAIREVVVPRASKNEILERCDKCDGYGFVIWMDRVFRARCRHGEDLSSKIAFAPENQIEEFNFKNKFEREDKEIYGKSQEVKNSEVGRRIPLTMSDEDILNRTMPNPVKYARGFLEISKIMKISNSKLYQKIKTTLLDVVGKDRIKKIALERKLELQTQQKLLKGTNG